QVGYAALGRRQTSVHIPATAEAWSAKTPAVYAGSCASLNTACASVCVQIYLRTTRYTEVPSSGELNGGYRQRTTAVKRDKHVAQGSTPVEQRRRPSETSSRHPGFHLSFTVRSCPGFW
ncbi:unnamed protein product, partial [Pylaiella littoralis]